MEESVTYKTRLKERKGDPLVNPKVCGVHTSEAVQCILPALLVSMENEVLIGLCCRQSVWLEEEVL